jgi:hypothetical protein
MLGARARRQRPAGERARGLDQACRHTARCRLTLPNARTRETYHGPFLPRAVAEDRARAPKSRRGAGTRGAAVRAYCRSPDANRASSRPLRPYCG